MAKASGADTPVMRQFLAAKAAHPDAIVFFRLGDFYEIFFADAVVAAKALDLTLTSRNKNAEEPIPMCGVPYHAASGYVQRLLDLGHKVAICEQMADPSKVKGIVPREVVRVVTPAIAFDDAGLDAQKNLFLAGVELGPSDRGGRVGIAVLDFSTGELLACEAEGEEATVAELVRLDPREEASEVALDAALEVLDDALGLGAARRACTSDVALLAAARCVSLARVCEPGRRLPVSRLVEYRLGDTLVLDDATQRHLELVRTMDGETKGSLLAQIDATRTAPGARLLRRRLLAPRTSVAEIRRRLDAVEAFVTQPGLRAELRERLDRIADVERLAVKLAVDRIGPRELGSLRTSLAELPYVDEALAGCHDAGLREALGATGAAEPVAFVERCVELHAALAQALADELPPRASDGGVFREGFDPELDAARTLARDGQRLIVELEARLREASGISSLKLRFTRVFGWYIEVTRSHLAKAPKAWRRKQTIATGERYTCDELDELADELAHAEERLSSREAELWTELVRSLATHADRLRTVAARLAEIDVACALAEVAHRDDYTRPEVDDSLELVIEDGRHPVVERLAAAGRFVPNDVALDAAPDAPAERSRLWIVTGPNMAGKSTFMRQVALAVILAQMGSFVPARRARVGVVDRLLTRVGASDNLARGESTFMVEMKETANILRRGTRRSLVVLDEIGRGTSTYDGLSIAWAVAEHLHDVVGCRGLFATHYHELTEIVSACPRAENHSVSAREHDGTIVFFHKVQRGAASRSYGVACARLAGLPEPVLARARALLDGLEGGVASTPRVGVRPAKGGRRPPQMDLFGGPVDAPSKDLAPAPAGSSGPAGQALDMLRALDIDRLTPLEALTTLAKLKGLAGPSSS